MQERTLHRTETSDPARLTCGARQDATGSTRIALTFRDVSYSYRRPRRPFEREAQRVDAVADFSLDVIENELVVIIGQSGCGKSTLLSIAAGLVRGWSGSVELRGRPIQGPGRERGIIFQEFALFPWLTVQQNVEFPLKLSRLGHEARRERARGLLESMGLRGCEDRFPRELSGGMKQRVAVARAYAANHDVLLMDEPFGALDAQTRAEMQQALIEIWQSHRKTILFVTHDVGEALQLGDRVVVMGLRPGRNVGEIPLTCYARPRDLADPVIQRRHREILDVLRKTSIVAETGGHMS